MKMNEKMMEFVANVFTAYKRGLCDMEQAVYRMSGYTQCMCDMDLITDETRQNMNATFCSKLIELEKVAKH